MAEIYVKLANGTMQKVHLETDSAQVKGLSDAVKIIKVDNTVSADKLANAKEIKIQDADGNASTAANFDGSENVNLNLPDTILNQKQLGYRQPSTAYAVGNIAYHSALPTGYYLECTTAGTTDGGDLVISGTITPNVTTVSDGTVTWIVRYISFALYDYGKKISDFNEVIKEGMYYFSGNTLNLPLANQSGKVFVTNISVDNGNFNPDIGDIRFVYQSVITNNNVMFNRIKKNDGTWSPWQQQEAIVAKSLGANGYIKYASGLIVQWGFVEANITGANVTLPVSFTNKNFRTIMGPNYAADDVPYTQVQVKYVSASEITIRSSVATTGGIHWLAIGY